MYTKFDQLPLFAEAQSGESTCEVPRLKVTPPSSPIRKFTPKFHTRASAVNTADTPVRREGIYLLPKPAQDKTEQREPLQKKAPRVTQAMEEKAAEFLAGILSTDQLDYEQYTEFENALFELASMSDEEVLTEDPSVEHLSLALTLLSRRIPPSLMRKLAENITAQREDLIAAIESVYGECFVLSVTFPDWLGRSLRARRLEEKSENYGTYDEDD